MDTKLLSAIQEYQKHLESNYYAISGRNREFDLGFRTGIEEGSKYIRIFFTYDNSSYPQRSAHSFIEKKTGDIWKAAGWKAPAKNFPRGNIFQKTFKHIQWMGI